MPSPLRHSSATGHLHMLFPLPGPLIFQVSTHSHFTLLHSKSQPQPRPCFLYLSCPFFFEEFITPQTYNHLMYLLLLLIHLSVAYTPGGLSVHKGRRSYLPRSLHYPCAYTSAWYIKCLIVCAKLLQLCPTLCDPMDCSLQGSSVHGIFQARILEWLAIPFFRGCSWSRDPTRISCISCTGRQVLYHWVTWEALSWWHHTPICNI